MSEKIIDKVRKLLAKANGTENEAEAALFAAKAQELLAAHNIEMHELQEEQPDEFTTERSEAKHDHRCWRSLHSSVAKLYFCLGYYCSVGGQPVMFFSGRPHNIAVAKSVFGYLESTILRLATEHAKATRGGSKAKWKFVIGCANGLSVRISKMHAEATRPSAASNGLPALYTDEDRLIRQWLGGEIKSSKSRLTKWDDDMIAGFHASTNINLLAQVGGSSKSGPALLGPSRGD